MQYVSDVALAALATAMAVDCNGAFAVLSAFAAGQFVYHWWRRRKPAPAPPAQQTGSPAPPGARPPRAAELRAALAMLPADQQRIVQLRFIEGRRMHEIAAATGLSYDAIRAAQYEALTALAGSMRFDADQHPGAPPLS